MRLPYVAPMPRGGRRVYGGEPHQGQWDGERFVMHYRGRTYKIHRLVCEAFHGPAPFFGALVMHSNEDASVNKASNLAWGTQKENLNAPGFIAYCRSRTGDASPFRKGRAVAW